LDTESPAEGKKLKEQTTAKSSWPTLRAVRALQFDSNPTKEA